MGGGGGDFAARIAEANSGLSQRAISRPDPVPRGLAFDQGFE
jgi:hypothetical protein